MERILNMIKRDKQQKMRKKHRYAILIFIFLLAGVFAWRFFRQGPINQGCEETYIDDNGLVWCVLSTVRQSGNTYDFLILYYTQHLIRGRPVINHSVNEFVPWGMNRGETMGTTQNANGPDIRHVMQNWATANIPENLINRIVHANIPIEYDAPRDGTWNNLTAFSTPISGTTAGAEGVFLPSISEMNAMAGGPRSLEIDTIRDQWSSDNIGGLTSEGTVRGAWLRSPGLNTPNPTSWFRSWPGEGGWTWTGTSSHGSFRPAMWVRR